MQDSQRDVSSPVSQPERAASGMRNRHDITTTGYRDVSLLPRCPEHPRIMIFNEAKDCRYRTSLRVVLLRSPERATSLAQDAVLGNYGRITKREAL